MSYKNYDNKIEFIKNEFKNWYVDKGPENGIMQSGNDPKRFKYPGAASHCRNCNYTLVKMIEARNVLEIGSWHYESADSMANAIDELYGVDGEGVVDSFDIRIGGYDGESQYKPNNKRVNARYWYPHHSSYDEWKYETVDNNGKHIDIPHKEFLNMTNDEITEKNIEILGECAKPFGTYDLIFLDGDHSYEGTKKDLEICSKFADENTLFVLDNIWEARLVRVRDFFDDLDLIKWNFEEWNDEHYKDNMVQDTGIFILQKAKV